MNVAGRIFTIKAKIIAAYTIAFGLLLTGFAAIIYQDRHDAEIGKLDARLESHADKLQTELEESRNDVGFPSRAELDSIRTEGLKDVRIRLLTTDLDVVFSDAGFDLDTRLSWNSGPVANPKRATQKWNHHKFRIIQWPVEIEDQVRYVIQVAAPLHDLEEAMERLQLLFLLVIPAGLLLAGCAAYLITRLAFKPLMRMVETAEQISAENLDARLDLPRANDEIRQLGKALNEMIERIDHTLKGHRQFIADASHEFRTPLTIMRSQLEDADRSARTPTARRSIKAALAELDHLSSMVNNLLLLAKLDAARVKLEVGQVRLDELLVECVQSARPIARRNGIFLKTYIEEAIEIEGDHDKLKSVFLNLLDNAIKYSPRKRTVFASLVSSKMNSGYVSVEIRDQGMGIPSPERDHIFSRFYRGSQPRSKTEGSGLGLAIAHRFVALHKGIISVSSEEGKGSTFTVELPRGPELPSGS